MSSTAIGRWRCQCGVDVPFGVTHSCGGTTPVAAAPSSSLVAELQERNRALALSVLEMQQKRDRAEAAIKAGWSWGQYQWSLAHQVAASRLEQCVAVWPECYSGGYDPRCCRFPKSCSCNVVGAD